METASESSFSVGVPQPCPSPSSIQLEDMSIFDASMPTTELFPISTTPVEKNHDDTIHFEVAEVVEQPVEDEQISTTSSPTQQQEEQQHDEEQRLPPPPAPPTPPQTGAVISHATDAPASPSASSSSSPASSSSATIACHVHVEEEEDVCSICLDEFSENEPAQETKCGHRFHLQCTECWLQRSDKCPMCWKKLVYKWEDIDIDAVAEQESAAATAGGSGSDSRARSDSSPVAPRAVHHAASFHQGQSSRTSTNGTNASAPLRSNSVATMNNSSNGNSNGGFLSKLWNK
eukprot:GEZU01025686.1.p1 GENE.GEZU01025686.1~~GEZU01025686.1.p1  ORF type:complete len:289 (-),score=72.46 GEZU01025686.1:58-924(-)